MRYALIHSIISSTEHCPCSNSSLSNFAEGKTEILKLDSWDSFKNIQDIQLQKLHRT